MTAFVLDASMTMAWHFDDETTDLTLAIEEMADASTIVVPAHWYAEVANTMLMGERRKRATLADTARFVQRIGDLDLVVDEITPQYHLETILPLARAHGLTVYDTLYLELAERRGLPLASLDRDLNAAARRVGLRILGEQP